VHFLSSLTGTEIDQEESIIISKGLQNLKIDFFNLVIFSDSATLKKINDSSFKIIQGLFEILV